ncbi:unnamed protein product [Porites lobata]|uniref:G-protein coupled receptors family 1 profile domain-containing protein n=1 Tax=Porites lobata TaxID=104759 RepID=A0ABN8NEX9_9CNID|nr:unnamed protein product [Porites lobata]
MIAVKMKARLRVHKSNIALALLASTDLTVGVLVQPLYVALMRTILLDGTSSASYALQVLTRVLCSVGVSASLIHMALISGERFLAMRRPFAHLTLAFKATFIVIVVLMLCYFPILIFRAVLIRYRTKISSEVLYIYLFLATLMAFLNSLLNPVIYSFRLREFRLAFIKLIFNSSEHCRG